MNILFCDMGSYTYRDIVECFEKKGFETETFYYSFSDKYRDEYFSERLLRQLTRKKYDCVFSVNFFPVIAVECQNKGIPYISWSYDSPLENGFEEYFDFDTNFIFLFDREEAKKYKKNGHDRIYHMPLAVNTKRLDKLVFADEKKAKYSADISFVGSLYEAPLEALLYFSDDYVKGYVEGVFQAQLQVYGANIIESGINDEIIDMINSANKKYGKHDVKINKRGLAYAIANQMTHVERVFLLNELSNLYDTHLYSYDADEVSDKVKKHSPVKYYSDMNAVFRYSKLNLCPTLRSITSGIPLRALDVMGVGGVLFSNYQPELAEYFVDGEDVIMYSDIEDAFDKAEYYLNNDEIRKQIGINGHNKVVECFDYDSKIDSIMGIVFG